MLRILQEHGRERFRKIDIWDRDWNSVAALNGTTAVDLSDPRSTFERVAHRVLKATQGRRANVAVRAFEKLLRSTGW